MKYTVITSARDVHIKNGKETFSREYITDDTLYLFDTKDEAFNSALKSAEDEVERLNEGSESSFGIPYDREYEEGLEIKVYGYGSDDNTELVTRRVIKAIQTN